MKNCTECPHRSIGFMSEPATCVYGERVKTPYEYYCSSKHVPSHCPIQCESITEALIGTAGFFVFITVLILIGGMV